MDEKLKKEVISCIEITRDNLKNSMELTMENYAEALSKLDMLTYLVLAENKK